MFQVEQFWALYGHLARPCELTSSSDYHLFKQGIKPMWEVSVHSNFPTVKVTGFFPGGMGGFVSLPPHPTLVLVFGLRLVPPSQSSSPKI